MARTAPIKLDQTQKQKEQTKISKWINSESYTKVLQRTMFCMDSTDSGNGCPY